MTKIIAHRGASNDAPENTMAAFELALEQMADGIECDVHLARDNKLAVVHDHQLGRTMPGKGYIRDYSLAELQELDCGSWFSTEFKSQKIPELRDVLKLIKSTSLTGDIEIKYGSPYYSGLEEHLVDEIKKFQLQVLSSMDSVIKLLFTEFYNIVFFYCEFVCFPGTGRKTGFLAKVA